MVIDKRDFESLLKNEKSYNTRIYDEAISIYEKNIKGKDVILQHTPFLY